MQESNKKSLNVIQISTLENQRSFLPSSKAIVSKAAEVATEQITNNLSAVVQELGKVMDGMQDSVNYEIDKVTYLLNIDCSGKVSLVGELSAGLSSGITITMKKKKQ